MEAKQNIMVQKVWSSDKVEAFPLDDEGQWAARRQFSPTEGENGG